MDGIASYTCDADIIIIGKFDDSQLDLVREMKEVEYIEQDKFVRVLQNECTSQADAPWNLVRTTVHEYPQDGPPKNYKYGTNGEINVCDI